MIDAPRRRAVIDANILLQRHVRDVLLHASSYGELYDVRWSDTILEETRRTFLRLGRASESRALAFVAALNREFPDALVTGYEWRIAQMTNHPKDRHVAAAAVHAGADIVTFNLRDFRPADLVPFGIRAAHPDDFLLDLLHAAPETMAGVLHDLLTEPQYRHFTADGLLRRLERAVPRFAAAMRAHLLP